MIAASGTLDLGRLLLDLLVVLAAAKIAAELAERVRVPAVLGEIVAGIAIGPSGLDLVDLGSQRGVSVGILAEIGVLLLLLSVGMEMDLRELAEVGRASLLVAVIGVAAPFAGGTAVGLAFGESTNTAIFFGAALTATSVGITARVFGDLRALASVEARVVLGAAVADDVLGLVLLTVVVKAVTGGGVGVGVVLSTLGIAVLFLLATGAIGLTAVPPILRRIERHASSGATVTVAALALMLGFAALADSASLAFIIGAFMAGLALGRSDQHERIARDLGAVGNVLIPVFFVQIGLNADLAAMTKPSVLGLAAAMALLAIAGKLVAAWGAIGTRADKLVVGLGMLPRGEVGLIFASIGLANGVLDADQYGALLLVVLVTTLLSPPLLRLRLGRVARGESPAEEVAEPPGGWVVVRNGTISLAAPPPPRALVQVALAAAPRCADAVPGEDLLSWFHENRQQELHWTHHDTEALVALLRADEPRAWRLLDVTGVLERTLPEIASSMARRRADMSDLDPLGSLRFPTVDRLHEVAGKRAVRPSDAAVLAAMVLDVAKGTDLERLAQRLRPPDGAERIARLTGDAALLRATARDPWPIDEKRIAQLATHLASADHVRDAHLLALSLGDLQAWQTSALEERVEEILAALAHPELQGGSATNLAAVRRVEAQRMLDSPAAVERLDFASNAYLLSHDAEELARHARLVEPLPHGGTVRVAVSPHPDPGRWTIDVACRDRTGLLARLTNVLERHGCRIVAAVIETWPDGAVLDSFVVHADRRPDARGLARAFEAAGGRRRRSAPAAGLAIRFDGDALPWHTTCVVELSGAGDLSAVTSAFADARVVVHSARVSETQATFAITDRAGRKLSSRTAERVGDALAGRRRTRSSSVRAAQSSMQVVPAPDQHEPETMRRR